VPDPAKADGSNPRPALARTRRNDQCTGNGSDLRLPWRPSQVHPIADA